MYAIIGLIHVHQHMTFNIFIERWANFHIMMTITLDHVRPVIEWHFAQSSKFCICFKRCKNVRTRRKMGHMIDILSSKRTILWIYSNRKCQVTADDAQTLNVWAMANLHMDYLKWLNFNCSILLFSSNSFKDCLCVHVCKFHSGHCFVRWTKTTTNEASPIIIIRYTHKKMW